ncbi:MAG: hypothetical protein AAF789_10420 [Bacteroidota bacterium]
MVALQKYLYWIGFILMLFLFLYQKITAAGIVALITLVASLVLLLFIEENRQKKKRQAFLYIFSILIVGIIIYNYI